MDPSPPDDGDESHWVSWHRAYDVDGSTLQARIAIVKAFLRRAIDAVPAGPVTILSLCAGRGTDVIDVLAEHPRAATVRARLVELDPVLTGRAAGDTAAAGLRGVEVVTGDASTTNAAGGAVPADVIVAAGIFGNISDEDIEAFPARVAGLAAPGATVIWTRHRRPPDLTPAIQGWFAAAGFEEVDFAAPDELGFVGVGAHRLVLPPPPYTPDQRLFTFVGDGRPA